MVFTRKMFSPGRLIGITGVVLSLTLAGCSTLTGAFSAVIGVRSSQSNDSERPKDPPARKSTAYQYEFNTFYGSMWNMGWLGYRESSYKVGQGTIWRFTSKQNSSDDAVTFERALLRINPDSSQWWRFKLDTGKKSTLYEFLVSADGIVLKVRFKDPDSGKIEEFTPGSGGPPAGPSDAPKRQSDLAKYHVDRQTVKVQAGSYSADHYRYSDERGSGTTETWVSQSVPGSILRSVYTQSKDKQTSTVELIKIEIGVTTALGSF
jgi:hypothetical protein